MHVIDHQPPRASRTSRYVAFALVVLLHILILLAFALQRAGMLSLPLPPIEVLLVPGGGGAPTGESADQAAPRAAAPSSVHAPQDVPPHPGPLVVPPEPAPQVLVPELNPGLLEAPAVQAADQARTLEGSGAQSGRDGGAGTGVGTGAGDSVGAGALRDGPAQWVRLLTPAERDAHYPRAAASRALSGTVVLNCTIFASTRIERCRIVSETPRREGFGPAALRAVRLMRMRPPVVDGRVLRAHRMNVTIHFTPPDSAVSAQPAG